MVVDSASSQYAAYIQSTTGMGHVLNMEGTGVDSSSGLNLHQQDRAVQAGRGRERSTAPTAAQDWRAKRSSDRF